MGVPRAFRSDNGSECTNRAFVELCTNLGIRRELTAPYTPQQDGHGKSAISRAFKSRHTARLEIGNIYPDIRLEKVKSSVDAAATSLWRESLLWASDVSTRLPHRRSTDGCLLTKNFCGSRPLLSWKPPAVFQPAYHRVPNTRKKEPRNRLYCSLNFGYNHVSQTIGCGDEESDLSTGRPIAPPRSTLDCSRERRQEFTHSFTGGHIRAFMCQSFRLLHRLQYRLPLPHRLPPLTSAPAPTHRFLHLL